MAKKPRQLPGDLDNGTLPLVVNYPSGALIPTGVLPIATPFNDGLMSKDQAALVGGVQTYPTLADFPSAASNQGKLAIASDTGILYCANQAGWFVVSVLA